MEDTCMYTSKQTNPVAQLQNAIFVTLVSLVVLSFSVFFWWNVSQFRTLRRSILITGLPDAGKTLLFVRLIHSHYMETFTSLQENIDEYVTYFGRPWRIIDLPGQDQLRERYFNRYKYCARGIVFVIDSVTILGEVKDVAEFLYTILLDPVIRNNAIPILILCNKQDKSRARDVEFIKVLLEEEMHLVRLSRVHEMQYINPTVSKYSVYLGKPHEDFAFAHLDCKVDIVECSALTGEDENPTNMLALKNWIDDL